ncbi:methyltransferase domain protein [Ceratobasidium sp. AG-Ba]|nr:methyltransferase domain protein [Ceratobasidium sp. AG-Ba]QRW01491.1 methyltransferase domain protein [Ceratobasidium sp. AG-Ba]
MAHPQNKLTLAPSTDLSGAQDYEDQHVHGVYEQIAPHFSQTRYKPWPVIAKFLQSIPAGSIGLDSGTGNGKYLPLSEGRFLTIGVDRSAGLLKFAQFAGDSKSARDVLLGDVRDRIWRRGIFDFAISIATIHHLATLERRKEAVAAILECLDPNGGRALLYVWAVDQDNLSKRVVPEAETGKLPIASTSSTKAQDVLVPWVMQQPNPKSKCKVRREQPQPESEEPDAASPVQDPPTVFKRYYHLFVAGELTELVVAAATELGLTVGGKPSGDNVVKGQRGVEICSEGWERSNYYVELIRWAM